MRKYRRLSQYICQNALPVKKIRPREWDVSGVYTGEVVYAHCCSISHTIANVTRKTFIAFTERTRLTELLDRLETTLNQITSKLASKLAFSVVSSLRSAALPRLPGRGGTLQNVIRRCAASVENQLSKGTTSGEIFPKITTPS